MALALLVFLPVSGAWSFEAVPPQVVAGNAAAVEAIAAGARLRTVWIAGKFGEYGAPLHRLRFDRSGNLTAVDGKFIRLGDRRFAVSVQGNDWLVRGKFGDGGSDTFLVRRDANGRVTGVAGRFYHYGDRQFTFRYDDQGLLQGVEGKFGQEGSPGFSLLRGADGRVNEIRGKFLPFGDSRFRVGYYGATGLVRSVAGRFARWGDPTFRFYYEAWSD